MARRCACVDRLKNETSLGTLQLPSALPVPCGGSSIWVLKVTNAAAGV
jgi:hypothetical protein